MVAGGVREQSITEELKQSYINYAMSVIVARALPDVRDGLKPVQRRILYTMQKMNIMPGSAYKKVARIVGECMGKYHPHGDSSISDALVRMGQDFNMRYTLVDGQGNYGSIDGDPPAAMRYIEARLDKYGSKILEGLDKSTVNFGPNYDGNEEEPEVLPGLLPNMLVNGNEGIAVGMATKMPPHNLSEVIDAIQEVLSTENIWEPDESFKEVNYEEDLKTVNDLDILPKTRFRKFASSVELKDLLKHVKGPDFPTRGEIYDSKEIQKIYETGKGRALMRAVSEIEEMKGGKYRIIVTELPYQVNKSALIAKIANLYKDKKIEGITDLRDESNREGIRIVIELKRDVIPKTVENQLYKYTEMQKAFNANMLALVDGEPQLLPLKKILELYISHRQEIVTRRNEHELAKLREREHILEGLMIALDNIDEIIKIIRESADADVAKTELMKRFKLSEIQSQAILDMQLRKLAALERLKIEQEYKEVKERIKELLSILTTPQKVIDIITEELKDLKDKLGDKRLTKVFKGKVGEINEEDLIAEEQTLITISKQGYIKRTKIDNYQQQKRGGVGKKAQTTKDDDSVRHVFKCSTHDQILFFSNKGKVYSLKVYEIPEYSRTAKGLPLVNLIQMQNDELVTSVLTRSQSGAILDEDVSQEGEEKTEHQGKDYKYLLMATQGGVVKKTALDEFDNIRSNGLIAITLDDGDELVWVRPTTGEDDAILITKLGKSIHFTEDDVRPTGRSSKGVRGIRLKEGDTMISMDVIRNKEDFVLTVSASGYGKMTKISEFTKQNRGGTGIFAMRVTKKTGTVTAARLLDHPDKELLIMSAHGQAVRIPTKDLPVQGRQTSGVRLMKLRAEDSVAALAVV
ncbi:DNA gyrase subunit A [Candidatus Dojkabacteria bacterium]|uniref:DNA gyrase subunit A n=1 Tax=Candidatus Dojkabacteria bacterium TaxID=2099670 RepID=A0A955L2C3_9BACT|nr:DNA gyrase subunit A [Candidatus Dojkabacteria bacterium]